MLSNHDQPRIAARAGEAQAGIAAMLLLTLRGTPTLYYGDELGIGDVAIAPGRVQDPWARQEPDASFNRDKARTPMQWSAAAHAGFSDAEPWLPLTGDWRTRNVAALEGEQGSILELHRRLLALCRCEAALRHGGYARLLLDEHVFAYQRRLGEERMAVFLNFTGEARDCLLPEGCAPARIILSTRGLREEPAGKKLSLAADEGVILRLGENSA